MNIDRDGFASILGYFTLMKVDLIPGAMWFSTPWEYHQVFKGYGALARRERFRRIYEALRYANNNFEYEHGYRPDQAMRLFFNVSV